MHGGAESVQLAGWPAIDVPAQEAARLRADYAVLLEVRDVVTKSLEDARGAGIIGKSQEAALHIVTSASARDVLIARGPRLLADLLMVSEVEVSLAEGSGATSVEVLRAEGDKCPRCWNIRTDIGGDRAHPELCARCAGVLSSAP
jgi:isoleucyl-tRNA synthetase